MMRLAVSTVLIWLSLASLSLAEKRVALVLAAEDYDSIRALTNPANDARAMEDLLESLDFEVFVETNRDLRRMRRALDDFKEDAAGADVALLFFAGHGVALDGVNYLLPTDADVTSAETLAATALPLSEAQEALKVVAPVAIVLLDACRDDPFGTGAGATKDDRSAGALDGATPAPTGKPVPGLGRIGRADGVLFAFAASPNETAADGTGDNSPFTEALVRHLGTAGVELRTALTLVQQDVYDRSRGKQLPYIESGLPELIFITGQGALPERDQLLIAMAGLTPDLRAEVESIAAERNMPLAPLYAAVLSADLASQTPDERTRLLLEAAQSYQDFQSGLLGLQSDDPRVADLRAKAQESFALGAFDTGRALLDEAAEIDAASRVNFVDSAMKRTVSEAATRLLSANAARAELRYDLAIEDLTKVAQLYGGVQSDLLDRDTQFIYMTALSDLGELQLVAGNTQASLDAFTVRSQFAQAAVEANPTDVAWVRELVWSLNSMGNVLQQQGYMPDAEAAYASALEFSQWQADQMPDDLDLMRDRMVARNKVGEVRFARDDFAGALQAHGEALALAEALYAADPISITSRRDISFTQERMGDALLATGDKEAARQAFNFSLEIAEGLATEYPDNEDIRRDLSVSYERIGDILVDDYDYDGGLNSYGQSLTIREELAALDPDNKLRQRDLAVTFERIGDINGLRGDQDSALLGYQASLAIRERLAALDPTNMLWQRDLSVTLERVGDVYLEQSDLVAALEAQERSYTLRAGIVMLDPENLPRQRDLGVAIERVGDVKLAMGDREGALMRYREALELRQSLRAADPASNMFLRDVTFSLIGLSNFYSAEGDFASAEPLIAEMVTLRNQLVGAAPDDPQALLDLTIAQNMHSAALTDLGDPTLGLEVGHDALASVDRLLQMFPDVPDYIQARLVTLNRIGDALVALGEAASAVDAYRAMADEGSRLLDIDPYNTSWANDLSVALERLGNAQASMGDIPASLKSHQDGLALRDWLSQQDPANVDWYRNLSISYERVATMLAETGDMTAALEHQDMSLSIMRDLSAAYPDDPWLQIDVVRALDLQSTLLSDPTPPNEEALAILQEMYAAGTLPEGYVEWIPAFQRALGLPEDF
jgi:uncharacterized caspase-like protein